MSISEAYHLAEVTRAIQETAHELSVVYERWREDALAAERLAERQRIVEAVKAIEWVNRFALGRRFVYEVLATIEGSET